MPSFRLQTCGSPFHVVLLLLDSEYPQRSATALSAKRRNNQILMTGVGHSMDQKWNEDLPIYRQLRDRVVAMILEGALDDGDALPSVRNVAAEYRLNPLTVLKGYQELVDEALVEKKRGRGMFVTKGARVRLLKDERRRFLDKEWPVIAATIQRLGLDLEELLEMASKSAGPDNNKNGEQDD